MDMLNIDLNLQNDTDNRRKARKRREEAAQKNQHAGKPNNSTNKRKRKAPAEDDYAADDAAFHFIAYVPINGKVWKLDGLNRQPEKVGAIAEDTDWLSLAASSIQSRLAQFDESQIEFSAFAMVHDEAIDLQHRLAQNVKDLVALRRNMEEYSVLAPPPQTNGGSDLTAFLGDNTPSDTALYGPDDMCGITSSMIEGRELSRSNLAR